MHFNDGAISFPGLGIEGLDLPRTLPFTIFGKEIYYYGVIIALGFLLAIVYTSRRVRQFGTDMDHVIDAILFAVPLAIICARIYYVAFQWEHYKDNPISVLYIWEGGIAIYGGVIGATLGLLLFAKLKKQKLTPYLDIMALGLLIGQCIGRWGNFFNREAFGTEIYSHFFLRMGIEVVPGVSRYWHPTFLYESVWNLIGFLLLHFLSTKRKYDGQTFLQYLAWYGLGRVWIEGLRTDSLYLGGTGIRVSQLLAGVSFVAAVGVMLYIRLFREPDGSKLLVNQKAAEPAAADEAAAEAADEAVDEAVDAAADVVVDEAAAEAADEAVDEAVDAAADVVVDEAAEEVVDAAADEAVDADAAEEKPANSEEA